MCGTGVTSRILFTAIPDDCIARIAASRPAPGPLTITSISLKPCSIPLLATASAARWAANAVLFLAPLNPELPAEAQETVSRVHAVIVTIVFNNVD